MEKIVNCPITKESFCSYLNIVKERADFQDGIDLLCSKFNKTSHGDAEICMPSTYGIIIDVLEEVMRDKYETISWWCWELNFGIKYKDQLRVDDKVIDLSTSELLYNYLCESYE